MKDVQEFHAAFYKNKDKKGQDMFILHHCGKNFGENVKTIRLVCDGCGAQNKNSTVIGMLNYWFTVWSIIADRKNWVNFSSCRTLLPSPRSCICLNWKSKDWRTQKVLKQPGNWHFKFQPSKRIIVVKGKHSAPLVKGEAFYNNEVCSPKSLCRRGKMSLKWHQICRKL